MKVAIIGAGISGLLSALELIEQGCSVTIFDQQQAGKAASWAGGGILSPMYPWRYPQAVNELAQHGKALYQAWNEKLRPVSGIDFEIHESGMLIFGAGQSAYCGAIPARHLLSSDCQCAQPPPAAVAYRLFKAASAGAVY
jgi:glycine/D-amino acid oxidase-like deaminating enzyme